MLLTQRVGPDYADVVPNDAFRKAFVRLQKQHGLYREDTSAVTFLTPTLFRTGIPLPGQVPIGTYDVEIKLFANGALVTKTDTRVRDRQGRLRAVRRHNGATERIDLRPRYRRDGADDGLDGVDRVPEGLRPPSLRGASDETDAAEIIWIASLRSQ